MKLKPFFAISSAKMRHVLTAAVFVIAGATQPASAVPIDFDNLAAGIQNGNVLAASGVTFATGTIPNVIVGPFTFSNFDPRFSIFSSSAVSQPNIAVALGGNLNDVLMSFSTPITAISLNSDSAPGELGDVIRLIAVAPTGNPNEFQVIAVAEALDNVAGQFSLARRSSAVQLRNLPNDDRARRVRQSELHVHAHFRTGELCATRVRLVGARHDAPARWFRARQSDVGANRA